MQVYWCKIVEELPPFGYTLFSILRAKNVLFYMMVKSCWYSKYFTSYWWNMFGCNLAGSLRELTVTHLETHIQTDRQTDRHIHTYTHTHTHTHTNTQAYSSLVLFKTVNIILRRNQSDGISRKCWKEDEDLVELESVNVRTCKIMMIMVMRMTIFQGKNRNIHFLGVGLKK